MSTWQLAQLNVARLVAPDDSPVVAEFIAALDEVNALADGWPGFVWRFRTEAGNALAERPFPDDPLMLVNLSTWESVEALTDYVYRSRHLDYLRRRREWFEQLTEAVTVLWWVPSGYRPTPLEALDRLGRLRRHGPSPDAFTVRRRFAPAGEPVTPDLRDACPAG